MAKEHKVQYQVIYGTDSNFDCCGGWSVILLLLK